MKKRTWLLLFRLLVGVAALLFLIYKIDLNKLLKVFYEVNASSLFLFLLLPVIMIFFTIVNIMIIFNAVNVKVPFKELLTKYLVSRSFGFFLPGKFGELSLVYFLKDKVSYGVSTSAMIIDKLITFIVLLGFSLYGFFVFFEFDVAIRFILFLFLLLVGVVLLLFVKKVRVFVRTFVLRKYAKHFEGFGATVDKLWKERKEALLLDFIVTIILWGAMGLVMQQIFVSFGYKVGYLTVLSIHSIGVLSSLIPISISGLGIREGLVVYLYRLAGVIGPVSAGIYLISLFFTYLISTIILLVYNFPAIKERVRGKNEAAS